MSQSSDRNLLFGILALQLNFVSRDQLVAGMHAWVLDKAKGLGEIFVEQKAMELDQQRLLEALVDKQVEKHGGNVEQSLQQLSSVDQNATHLLREIDDSGLQATLAHMSADSFTTIATSQSIKRSSNRFRIIRPHARGGLGEVFVAQDTELSREVALKEIQNPYADSADSRDRFLREAEITGNLEHPGIVPVYGLGRYDDGRPFYAMRFIRGESLQEAIKAFHKKYKSQLCDGESGLALRKLLRRLVDVCNAIAYAHSRGVLHRDLKPGNIVLGKYGETLVVDWGLAKVNGSTDEHAVTSIGPVKPSSNSGATPTVMGSAIGTPAYMSPEQAAGKLNELGAATDVYSLGATLFHLLTGHTPIAGKSQLEVLQKAVAGEIRKPRELRNDVPKSLEAICLKAMAKIPTERYASPLELAQDIEKWLADEPVSACVEPFSIKARRWVRRHQTLVYSSAAVFIVTLAGLALFSMILGNMNRELAHANSRLDVANTELTGALDAEQFARRDAESTRDQIRRHLYAAHMNIAYSNRDLAEQLLDRYRAQDRDQDIRGLEWKFINSRESESRVLGAHSSAVYGAAYSPDGKTLATVGGDSLIRLWDVSGLSTPTVLSGHSGIVYSVEYSPNGNYIASAGSDSIKLWDIATHKEVFSVPEEGMWISFAPDGSQFATTGKQGTRITRTLDGSELLRIEQKAWTLDYSPDGRLLVVGGDDGVTLWSPETGQMLRRISSPQNIESVAISPDGKTIALHPGAGYVEIWDVNSGQRLAELKDSDGVRCLAFAPDGTVLATGTAKQNITIWDMQSHLRQSTIAAHTNIVEFVAFSPDGLNLASVGYDKLVRTRPVSSIRTHKLVFPGQVSSIDFAPESYLLATCTDGAVQLCDLATASNRLAISTDEDSSNLAVFLDGGSTIAVTNQTDRLSLVGRVERNLPVGCSVMRVVSSLDGKLLAAGCTNGEVLVWDVHRNKLVLRATDLKWEIMGLKFSPSGNQVVASDYYATYQWDINQGTKAKVREQQGAVFSLAFSPDGKRLAMGDFDLKITLLNTETRLVEGVFKGHMSGPACALAFSSDGMRLASGSLNGEVHLWNIMDAEAIPTKLRDASGSNVNGVCFSMDDAVLVAACGDAVQVWWSNDVQSSFLKQTQHLASNYAKTHVPYFARAHIYKANRLAESSRSPEALNAYDEAIKIYERLGQADALNPNLRSDLARSHFQRGELLAKSGKRKEALAAHEQAKAIMEELATENVNSPAHQSRLGVVLDSMARIYIEEKQYTAAKEVLHVATKYEKSALQANPKYSRYRSNLKGHYESQLVVAKELGDSELAKSVQRDLVELLKTDPRFATQDARMAKVLQGEATENAMDLLTFGTRCYELRRYVDAARFFDQALQKQPALAEDRSQQILYNAACCAALAQEGQDIQDPMLNDKVQGELRAKALGWLKAELDRWDAWLAAANSEQRAAVGRTMKHWKLDADLNSVRDEKSLAKLPDTERSEWLLLWKRVEELLAKAEAPAVVQESSQRP